MSVWLARKRFVSSTRGWLLSVSAIVFTARRLQLPLGVFFRNTVQAVKEDYVRYVT